METTMRNFEEALALILLQTNEIDRLERTRPTIKRSSLSAADKVDKIDELNSKLNDLAQDRVKVLSDLVAYPPHLLQYAPMVRRLQQIIELGIDPGGTVEGNAVLLVEKSNPCEEAQFSS